MGISRDRRHKRRPTGGRFPIHQKKRKFEMGRASANTKLGAKRVRSVRCRGGNLKWRALRMDAGNYSWATENVSRKSRIFDVVYNASNNEMVRTKTLVKNSIILIDATPFKQWYKAHYGIDLGKKRVQVIEEKEEELTEEQKARQKTRVLDPLIEDQIATGKLMACISSRPGQVGRVDGYILEGKELEFYKRKVEKKKK